MLGIGAALSLVFLIAGTLVGQTTASGAPVTAGYRDYAYGSSVTAPTAQKPQSKMWHTPDGTWWAILWNPAISAKRFEIHRFDMATQSWSRTGVVVDTRRDSLADAVYDTTSGKLAVLTHVGEINKSTDKAIRFYQFSFSQGEYTRDDGYPVTIASGMVEGAVVDQDSTGVYWATWTEPNDAGGRRARITHSSSSAASWVAPFDLPAPNSGNLTTDDMSALVAYNTRVGVMWSNQVVGTLNFAFHQDGDPDAAWTTKVLCDPTTFGNSKCADDHFNLKSLDADGSGRVFALAKTSLNDLTSSRPTDPLMILWHFDPASPVNQGWSRSTVWTVEDNVTRGIMLLDTANREVYAIASSPYPSGGVIYMKRSSYDSPTFAPGPGTAFIQSSLDPKINNATATKQPVDSGSGLLVLASDDSTRQYLHSYLPLDVTPPNTTITSGPSASTTATDAAFAYTSTQVGSTFQCSLDGAAFTPCPAEGSARSELSPGAHTFAVAAVGASGTVDPTPATWSWTIVTTADTDPPDTTITAGPAAGSTVTDTTAAFGYGSSEPDATFACRLDGASTSCPSAGVTYAGLGPGDHTFTVAAKDGAGNVDPTPATRTWTIAPGIQALGQVGQATATTAGTTLVLTTTQAVGAGSRVVVAVGYSGTPAVGLAIADSAGNSYTVDVRKDNGTTTGSTSAVASSALTTTLPAGSTITVTLTASATYRLAAAFAYANTSALVGTSAATAASAAPASGAVSTSVAPALVLGVTAYNSGTVTHAPGAGLTELLELRAGTKTLAVDQMITSGAGAFGDSGSLSASVTWTDSVAVYG